MHVRKGIPVRLAPDPVVAQKHHRFLAVLVADIDELPYRLAHEFADEAHVFAELFLRAAEGAVITAPVHEILRAEPDPRLLFESVHEHGIGGLRIAEPLDEFFFAQLVENEGELIEEGGETHHVGVGVFLAPPAHMFLDIFPRVRIGGVVSELLLARPVVGQIIVDLHGVPCDARHEGNGVFVHAHGVFHRDDVPLFVRFPIGGGNEPAVVLSTTSQRARLP